MFENTVAVAGGVGRTDAAAVEVAAEAVGIEPEATVGSLRFEELGADVTACAAVDELFCALGLPPQPAR